MSETPQSRADRERLLGISNTECKASIIEANKMILINDVAHMATVPHTCTLRKGHDHNKGGDGEEYCLCPCGHQWRKLREV